MGDAGRVIAGVARGRRLQAPGDATRPLADRVKQTLFAILEPDLRGSSFLDLFAGSGAAGIEAHLAATGLGGPRARVLKFEVGSYLGGRAAADGPFDIIFADPPYRDASLLANVLERLAGADKEASPMLGVGARVVAKHFWRDVPPERIGLLASERERRFGETALTFYRRVAETDGEPAVEEG